MMVSARAALMGREARLLPSMIHLLPSTRSRWSAVNGLLGNEVPVGVVAQLVEVGDRQAEQLAELSGQDGLARRLRRRGWRSG